MKMFGAYASLAHLENSKTKRDTKPETGRP